MKKLFRCLSSVCAARPYMIVYMRVADKIPYSIYSDGNFKRRHIVCVFCCLKARSIYFKEISYAKFHRNPSNMNG